MKKFVFSLERVLSYKEQAEQNLRNEHGQAVRAVQKKEEEIEALEKTFAAYGEDRRKLRRTVCRIEEIREYEAYLSHLTKKIAEEKQNLAVLRQEEERKRECVIEAKKETSSIQMLKEKKQREYSAQMMKMEERAVEEFVSNRSAAVRKNG